MSIREIQIKFREHLDRIHAYQHALTLLHYDAETAMPSAAASALGGTVGILSEAQYCLQTAPEFRALIEEILAYPGQAEPHLYREAEERMISLRKLQAIPVREYCALQSLLAESPQIWREAKEKADFSLFAPTLSKIVDYTVRFARYYDSQSPIYNVLLDNYQHGLTMSDLDMLFAEIKKQLPPLIARIGENPQPDYVFLRQAFPVERQVQFTEQLFALLHLDPKRCASGQSEHPFSTASSNRDVRVTTHYYQHNLLSSVYSTIHEGGHALYMMHVDDALNGTLLADGASIAMHESQSRLFENNIGRSRAFTGLLLKKLSSLFPLQLTGVGEEDFYLACNQSRRSLIRIEADELTYPLHIMIRYEIEKLLFNADISVDDLPREWNRLYHEYLGIEVPDDKQGVLQDIHWAIGSFGYFPTYALGSAYATQIMWVMQKEIDVWHLIRQENLLPIVEWLKEKILRFGGVKQAEILLREVCDGPFDPRFYTDYLCSKFNEIYHL